MSEISERKNIFLVGSTFSVLKNFFLTHPELEEGKILFLSNDAALFLQISESAETGFTVVETGDDLQAIALAYRQEFIDFIGKLSGDNPGICWWLTDLSEKNPFCSNLFLHLCYLKIFEKFLNTSFTNLIVVCNTWSLMETIQKNFHDRPDILIHSVPPAAEPDTNRLLRIIRCILKKGFFLARYSFRIALARVYALLMHHHPYSNFKGGVALHVWSDWRSFGRLSEYTDIFFGDMSARIRGIPLKTVYITTILPTMFFPQAVWYLAKCRETILLIEEFITIPDLVRSICTVYTKFPAVLQNACFTTLDISPLIRSEISNDRFCSTRSEESLLYFFAGTRISQMPDMKAFIYTFENHKWEKMLCLGIRRNNTGLSMIGYAHSIISPMYLFYTLSATEVRTAPLPDVILVNGTRARDVLRASGFSNIPIVVTGSFRYSGTGACGKKGMNRQGGKNILVITTAGYNESLELLFKVIAAFRQHDNLRIQIKIHPTLPKEKIRFLIHSFPAHFTICDQSVDQLLESSDLVIYTESAVAIEALARGIPILHIKSDLRIDMDIFEDSDRTASVSRPDDIATISMALLRSEPGNASKNDQLVESYFAPVNRNLEVLLKKRK